MTLPHLFLSSHSISLLANAAGWFLYVRMMLVVVLFGAKGFCVGCLGWLSVLFAGFRAIVVGVSVAYLYAGSHCSGMPLTSMESSAFRRKV